MQASKPERARHPTAGRLAALALAALGAAAGATEDAAKALNESRTESDGTRTLQQSIELPGTSLEQAWGAFTTSEGFRTWAAPIAAVDFRLGGIIEASYDPARAIGSPGNIRNEIVAFVPLRMLAFRNRETPPNPPFDAPTFQSLHTVVWFEPAGAATRITIAQPGYRAGEPWDTVYRHFERGNGWSLEQLRKRFVQGPVEWPRPKPVPAAKE
jgi:hypothetical protein